MTSPIGGISFPSAVTGPAGITGAAAAPDAVAQTTAAGDNGFASILVSSLEELQAKQATSDGLAVQAATGDLRDVHDYMIAANEAKLATDMVVTVKNKAVEAFNEILRMPI
ncbi:flagellar hook-basal body complex protein FliE [Geodermatophilus poikilotrophus]|uniref:Flagellar hook-basal body complex protein FliE n=1 Tax=Geodermatophilus poikilotrophus TaxID=1333667 RepID=A0A1I0II70_9ACTN|nr:flagellar hook-basal body complex protein FliE [Geodermatophilus poikilotrophus]SET96569.1 flagellar hook-basal body complex protein FliE [Geodermatophilus poikilotrophus]